MSKDFIEGQTFEGMDYTGKEPDKGAYEDCTFINCNFSNTDLSGLKFLECRLRKQLSSNRCGVEAC